MQINKIFICAGIIAFLCLAFNLDRSKADGGIFIPHDFSGYETGQRAFIYFTGQSETLVVSANFRANAKDFSWVIPTPAKPEVDKANANLFRDLDQITQTTEQSVGGLTQGLSVGAPRSSSVQVIEQKKVDIYDTAVLKATDEKALAGWLDAHGYNFPTDQNSELKSYVDNSWYFAIAKIQNATINQARVQNELMNGTLTPLKLTFASDKIIYPMKLTGIALRSASPSATATTSAGTTIPPGAVTETVSLDMPLKLYVLADHKVQNDALKTDWADWTSANNIANLNTNLGANDIKGAEKYYLTAMNATIPATKMVDDLTITNADNDQVYPIPASETGSFWAINVLVLVLTPIIMAIFPTGLIFVLFTLLQRYAIRRKWVYILGLIYETLTCLILAIICGGMLSLVSTGLLKEGGMLGFTIGALISLAVAISFTTKMFKRYKKTKPDLV